VKECFRSVISIPTVGNTYFVFASADAPSKWTQQSRPADRPTPWAVTASQDSFPNPAQSSHLGEEHFNPSSRLYGTMAAAAMTPDAITDAILAALSAGAVTGATDTAKKAIDDAYQGLKSLVKKKFGKDSDAAEALAKLEAKPDSDGRKQTLTEELKAVNAVSDPELASSVQSLLELIRALPQGEKHIQFAQGTGIARADRGSTATVSMHAPPKRDD
jgi:hypothetical protein